MDRRLYRTGQFARKASVSIRTLRYYDKEGLLSPTAYSEAGYRLYTDEDLVNLQQILALKFLGLSLDEIKALLRPNPRSLQDVLAQQKEMMHAKRAQLDGIIQAIDETEKLLAAGECDWDSLIRVIQAIQMEQNKDWVKKYLTPEQMAEMQNLSDQSYSDEAKQRLAQRQATMGEWTEADQERASAQWAAVNADVVRLADADTDPSSPEAQDLARRFNDLIGAFTGGDTEISKGLNNWWKNHDALPVERKPFPSPYTPEQQAWFNRVLEASRQG
ncbi:MAG: MerR family transcriptional regulator [Chloroflexota bacterium]|nr:MerR family transcriptional regulator [Chloroflexota bacterium]